MEFYKSLFKTEGKRSLFERAISQGLEPLAHKILNGETFNINSYIKNDLKSKSDVIKGIQDILVHWIVKNKFLMEEIRRLKAKYSMKIESKIVKDHKDAHKFENYAQFSCSSSSIKPHQILAIFRGENLKILKISIVIDERVQRELFEFAVKLLLKSKELEIFKSAFDEAFSKRISAFLKRQLKNELQKLADKAAISSFAENLKSLLLTCPVRGRKILGIDPGFKHGCKLALISENGDLLENSVIFPHERKSESRKVLVDLLKRHKCTLLALGNGTACRETETFIDEAIKTLENVEYSIVSEQGASIYSCTDIAKKEFPDMDTNIISSISIARRLMDPLSELVKIEPKHLGVGMYQHDVDEKSLNLTLNAVVCECVSNVGVDVNCASESLLKHVAGLSEKKAQLIVEHRRVHGAFKSREELKKVKSIGPVGWTQMIGFLRINKGDLLDATNIHPESYELSMKILKNCKLKIDDFGSENFTKKIKKFCEENSLESLAKKFDDEKEKVECILNTFKTESFHHDIRNAKNLLPIFKRGIQKMTDLKKNQIVSGVVRNIVDFGAFIDLGVQQDGLLHVSKYKNVKLKLGDRVELKIESIDVQKKRIGLDFMRVL